MKKPMTRADRNLLMAGMAAAALAVRLVAAEPIAVASYSYTSGDLAGPGAEFENANHSLYTDGFATTQADVDTAAGSPRAYYVNGSSAQRGVIVGRPGFAGDFGVSPQPGVLFDLGSIYQLTSVKVFYANLFNDGISSPDRVDIAVDGGTAVTFNGFDRTHSASPFGDARVVTIDLSGKSGQSVQMDFYNPRLEGFPDGEWTAISEIQFFGTLVAQEAPTIVQQPVGQEVMAGNPVTFSATARGTDPLSYQWLKGGNAIEGATNSTYTITVVEVSDAGEYSLKVTNSIGSATSNPATLTVDPGLPVITMQPAGGAIELGFSLTLRVAATGRQPMSYQWTKNGTAIADATNETYSILFAQSAAAGDYRVAASNAAGTTTSDAAAVSVAGDPAIVTASYTYTSGDLAGLGAAFEQTNHTIYNDGFATTQADVDAAAGKPLAYYVNGTSVQGAHIVGRPGFAGEFGVNPQPGVQFDLGAVYQLTKVRVFYANRFRDGVSSPASVNVSVDGGPAILFEGFDREHSVNEFGDAREVTIDLTGKTGRFVQMDFFNPRAEGFPDGEWTAINEIKFYGTLAVVAPFPVAAYTYTSGDLAGPGAEFEKANRSIYTDGFATTQADVDAAAGSPRAYYVNGSSAQRGVIVGRPGFAGDFGVNPQPGLRFDLGATYAVVQIKVFYANFFNDGISSPARVDLAFDGGAITSFDGFDRTHSTNPFGDARVATINLAGKTGRYVQMDFFNPRLEGFPDGEWTSINEILFFGTLTTPGAPMIVQQPVGQAVKAGTSTTFSATARGTEPLSYQWLKGGQPIEGATSSTYTITVVEVSDAGEYSLNVTNSIGSATSNPATLTVDPDVPVITVQPVGGAIEPGFSLTLRVAVTGRQPMSYQWTKNGTALADATNGTYSILFAQSADAGDYRVAVRNAGGLATSEAAAVSVAGDPAIVTASYTYTSGDLAGLGAAFEKTNHTIYYDGFATTQADVDAAAGQPLAYYVNGTSAQGAHIVGRPGFAGEFGVNPQPGLQFDLGAVYQLTKVRVFYANRFRDGVSSPASVNVSVDGGPALLFEGFDREHSVNQFGDAREITIDLTGNTGRFVQMDFFNPRAEDFPDGEWTALNEIKFYGTAAADAPPKIVQQPASLKVIAGESAILRVLASGALPLTYQWRKGTTPVTGATATSYTIEQAQLSDSGDYTVEIKNAFGTTVSDPATLTVDLGKPVITRQPASQTVIEDSPVTFSVEASGFAPIGYQWRKGGVPIPNATAATLQIAAAALTDQGDYSVEMANERGNATSAAATLTVLVAGPLLPVASYTYTSGDLAGAGKDFETEQPRIYTDGFATTQADVDAAAGQPLAYYVNGTSAQPGHIVGRPGFDGEFGVFPQPGVQFDLGEAVKLTHAKIYYANRFQDGVSSPAYVEVSVETGAATRFDGFDRTHSQHPYGDARVLAINLTGQSGRAVQMDFYNPRAEGFPDGEWTAISEIQFFGVPDKASAPIITRQPKGLAAKEGSSAAFSVSALGTAPLGYVWKKNGNPIAGATGAVYTIATVQASDAGDYSVVVSNTEGPVASAVAQLTVTADVAGIPVVAYTYTSGDLAGPGGDFEKANHSIYTDGFATTQADVDAAAGSPRAYYVNGSSAQRGVIVGRPGFAGDFGVHPQPGLRFDLGAVYEVVQIKVFYANLFNDGISSPARVDLAFDGGMLTSFDGFDRTHSVNAFGDARVATINLAGKTGRYVQMDFFNPRLEGAPDGEWTSISEIQVFGRIPGNLLAFTQSGGQLTLSWSGEGYSLQENSALDNPAGWVNVSGGNVSPVVIAIGQTGNKFYRLHKP